MSNAMKYIRDLEAAGFERSQAEAQVQMVLDAIEGDLLTKADFSVFQERFDNKASNFDNRFISLESRFNQVDAQFTKIEKQSTHMNRRFDQIDNQFVQVDNRFVHLEQQIRLEMDSRFSRQDTKLSEMEFRIVTRLGFLAISTASIAVAVLVWLIKI